MNSENTGGSPFSGPPPGNGAESWALPPNEQAPGPNQWGPPQMPVNPSPGFPGPAATRPPFDSRHMMGTPNPGSGMARALAPKAAPGPSAPVYAKWPEDGPARPAVGSPSLAGWLWLAAGVVMALSLIGGVVDAFTKFRPDSDGVAASVYSIGDPTTWYVIEVPSMLLFALVIPGLLVWLSLRYRKGSPSAWSWLTVLTGVVLAVMFLSFRFLMDYGAESTSRFMTIGLIGLFIATALSCTALGFSLTPTARAHTFHGTRAAGAPAAVIMIGAAWFFATGLYASGESALTMYGYVVPTPFRAFGGTNIPAETTVAVFLSVGIYVFVSLVMLGVVRAFVQGSGAARSFLAVYAGILVANVFFNALIMPIVINMAGTDQVIKGDGAATLFGIAIAVGAVIASFIPPAGDAFAAQKGRSDFTVVDGHRHSRIAALLWGASAHFTFMAFIPFLPVFVQGIVQIYKMYDYGAEPSKESLISIFVVFFLGVCGTWLAMAMAWRAFRLFTGNESAKKPLQLMTWFVFVMGAAISFILPVEVRMDLGLSVAVGVNWFQAFLAAGFALTALIVVKAAVPPTPKKTGPAGAPPVGIPR